MPHRLARLSSPRGRGRQAPRARPSRASVPAPMASGPGALESSRHSTSAAWRTPRRFPWRSEPGSQRPRGHDLRRDVRPAATHGPFAVRLHRPCVPGPVTTAVAGYDLCDATWTSRRGAEGLQRAARVLLGAPIAVGGDDRLELDRGLDLGDHVPVIINARARPSSGVAVISESRERERALHRAPGLLPQCRRSPVIGQRGCDPRRGQCCGRT
jgi:hypothetical protein